MIADPDLTHSPCSQSFISGPLSMYMCAGTQSERDHANYVVIMRAYELYPNKSPTEKDSEDDEEDSDEEVKNMEQQEIQKAKMKTYQLKHPGTVNRIRVSRIVCVGNSKCLFKVKYPV